MLLLHYFVFDLSIKLLISYAAIRSIECNKCNDFIYVFFYDCLSKVFSFYKDVVNLAKGLRIFVYFLRG